MRYRFNAQLVTGKSIVGDWKHITKEDFKIVSQNTLDGIVSGVGSVVIAFESYPVTYTNQIPLSALACLTIESRNE